MQPLSIPLAHNNASHIQPLAHADDEVKKVSKKKKKKKKSASADAKPKAKATTKKDKETDLSMAILGGSNARNSMQVCSMFIGFCLSMC